MNNKYSIIVLFLVAMSLFIFGCSKEEENVTYVNISEIIKTVPATPTEESKTPLNETNVPETKAGVEEKPKKIETKEEAIFTINAVEGELISLKPKAYDPDNDQLTYKYSSPFDAEGKWQTKVGDAGTYIVEITVSDGELSTSQKVKVIVNALNKAPVIDIQDTITALEGTILKLEPKVTDPDNDKVTITYSGFMTESTKTLGFNDAGSYEVTIKASDGKAEAIKKVKIIVEDVNRPPLVDLKAKDSVVEGEVLKLDVIASDPDGDALKITYPDRFNEKGEWQTKVGDAGTYKFVVKVSDGKNEITKEASVVVAVANHAPTIEIADTIKVKEGETIKLTPIIKDEDNDSLTITYSGWMATAEKKTTYEDAGTYLVTIKASDGKATTTKDVKIIVENVNRAPVITGFE